MVEFKNGLSCISFHNFFSIAFQGTPGVGKSRICAEIAKQRSMKWLDVSKIAKENGFVEEYDEKLECPILDEDEVRANRHLIENEHILQSLF